VTVQTSLLQAHEGGSIYDFAWYPFMDSQNPSSCIFVSTSRDQPIHMWDAFTGELRASYRAYDHLDEITAANSLAFNATGDKIFAGYDRMVRFFDVTQPGRQFTARPLCKTRKSRQGQRGIISTLHFNPDYSGIYAAGSYNGTTYVYTEDTGEELLCLRDHDGKGITQVQFSPDGRYLYTAARRDSSIHCWDIRQSTQIVQSFSRQADTNQRIEFDVHCSGKYLLTGSRDGRALLYDVSTGALLDTSAELFTFGDAVNGVSFFPDGTRGRVALTTGQRHYDLPDDMDDSNSDQESEATSAANQRKPVRQNALHVVELRNRN
jgi:telomerase Cajal body protein 1